MITDPELARQIRNQYTGSLAIFALTSKDHQEQKRYDVEYQSKRPHEVVEEYFNVIRGTL